MNRTFLVGLVVLFFFGLFMIVDLALSGWVMSRGGSGLESNPIYLYSGSFLLLVFLNLVVFGILAFLFVKYDQPDIFFVILVGSAFHIVERVQAIHSAWYLLRLPVQQVVDMAASTTAQELSVHYTSEVFVPSVNPLFVVLVVWLLFRFCFRVVPR